MLRLIKYVAGTSLAVFLGGFLIFGSDLTSMIRTSANSIRQSAREHVPVEFELDRAKDQINEILPDLQSQVRMIAEEEVAINQLEKEVTKDLAHLDNLERTIASLREKAIVQNVSLKTGEKQPDRRHLTKQLQSRFSHFKQAKLSIDSKQRLLEKRRQGLAASVNLLQEMRLRQSELKLKVESLAAQHRLIKASKVESGTLVDGSQLSKADQLLGQIENRLDVAQRVMNYENDTMDIVAEEEPVDSQTVLAEIDQYFTPLSNELVAEVK